MENYLKISKETVFIYKWKYLMCKTENTYRKYHYADST